MAQYSGNHISQIIHFKTSLNSMCLNIMKYTQHLLHLPKC